MSHRRTMSPGSVMLSLLLGVPPLALSAETFVVSVNSAGNYGDGHSYFSDISDNGRYVTFLSYSSNLDPVPASGSQIYRHDRKTQATTRISLGFANLPANGDCSRPAASDDGKVIVYLSVATNLSSADLNNFRDAFVYDATTQTTSKVSGTTIGGDSDGFTEYCDISGNGRYVVFSGTATNLVMGDTNGAHDVFLHDRTLNTTVRVSVDAAGNQGNGESLAPSISDNGRFIAFRSVASNFVMNDTNAQWDIFVKDMTTGSIERVSVNSSGTQANNGSSSPSISDDGRFVAFDSPASNLSDGDTNGTWDVFVHDRKKHTTTCASVGTDPNVSVSGTYPTISGNGRFVAFSSTSTTLGADGVKNGAFVRDLKQGKTTAASISEQKAMANDDTTSGSISKNGRFVTFHSIANNLTLSDGNAVYDVFVRDRKAKKK